MYNEQLEALISAALADGVLTEKEKQILFKRAQSMGIDLDEFEMVLDARLVELQKAEKEKSEKEKTEKSAPKSTKYGDVRKCPVCGALVPALSGSCPDCGYEFSGVDANASSKKLAEALLNENDVNKQKQIIETFPLPNTKADLLEFLTALKPRISDVKDPLSKSYFKKYEECIEKAKVVFPNDKLIVPFISDHNKIVAEIKKTAMINNVISFVKRFWILLAILVGFLLFKMWPTSEKSNADKCNKAIEQALLNNEPKQAAQYIYDYEENLQEVSKNSKKIIQEFLDKNQIGEATKLYQFFQTNDNKQSSSLNHIVDQELSDLFIEYYLSKDDVANAEKYLTYSDEDNKYFEKYWIEKGEYEKAWKNKYKNKNNLKEYVGILCNKQSKAAAKKFLNKHIDEIRECNVDGTFNSEKEDRIESANNRKAILNELNKFIDNQ